MSRYLTPSKIGLLVLVSLYCDSVVPNRAITPVLSFIISHLAPSASPTSDLGSQTSSPDPAVSIGGFERLTTIYPSNVPGRSLLDLFLRKLWAINSIDALHAFFQELNNYLARSPDQRRSNSPEPVRPPGRVILTRVSPLGIFIRRAQLEFTRIQFHDTVQLWIAFLKFRSPTEAAWRKRNPNAATSLDGSFSSLEPDVIRQACYGFQLDDEGEDAVNSSEDIERILEFQLDRLQRLGNRIPEDMKEKIGALVSQSSNLSNLAHFVRFFDAWRAGDYTAAFESLHRHFDYTTQTRDKSYYQYALLHMAILQADFGCFSEAIAAMNETISTARENQDVSCLNFSLSWLNHLSKAYPKEMQRAGYVGMVGSEREGFDFLKSKAIETKTWNLLSSTLLSETKLLLSTGDGIPEAFEHLYQSAHLNLVHHIEANIGTQLLMQSSLYGRLGLSQMADLYCEVLLDSYSGDSPVEETVRAICRRAYNATQLGLYSESASILEKVDSSILRTLKLKQYLISYSGVLRLKRDLRRQNLTSSEHLLRQLEAGASSEPDLDFQISLLEIQFLQQVGSFSAAYNKIEDKADELKSEDSDVYQRIHLLVLKSLLLSHVGKPSKGFTIALRAAAMALKANLLPALWEAVGALANILSALREFDMARALLDAVIPQALGGGDSALCGQLYIWQADAYMGLAGREVPGNNRAALLSKSEDYINKAGYYYEKIQDVRGECGILSKKSIIARTRGDVKLAADWATKYLNLCQKQFNEP